MADTLEIEILPDGSLKILTEDVSSANHRNAEDLLSFMAKLSGGERKREKRKHEHGHTHNNEHATHKH